MAVPAAPIATTTPTMTGLLVDIVSKIVISSLRTGRFFLPPGAVLFDVYPMAGHTDKYIHASYSDLLIDPASLASYVLAEGVTPAATAFASDNNNFSTVEYARVVSVTSEQLRSNPHGFFGVVAEKVANAAQDVIDGVAQTLWMGYAGKAPIILPGSTPAAANKIDTPSIMKAVASLQARGVQPIDGQFYGGMISPGVAATLMIEATAATGWTDAIRYADASRLITGEIGSYRGVRFFVNNRIPFTTGAVRPTFIFGKETLAFADLSSLRITSVAPVASISDPLAQRGAAAFAVRGGGMLISDVASDTTTRRYRFAVVESTADPLVVPA
jgi:N4-gp56 family major capsid protein